MHSGLCNRCRSMRLCIIWRTPRLAAQVSVTGRPAGPLLASCNAACWQPAAIWTLQLQGGCLQPLLPAKEWCLQCAGRYISSETAARRRIHCRLWRGGGLLCRLMSEENSWERRLCLAPYRCRCARCRHWHQALKSSRGRCFGGQAAGLVKPQLQGGPPLLPHVAMICSCWIGCCVEPCGYRWNTALFAFRRDTAAGCFQGLQIILAT